MAVQPITRPPAQPSPSPLNLRAGEIVAVRSLDEILSTLDENGRLEGLPFMPEMLKYCGRRLRVASRADKTCDRIERTGLRTVTGSGAVHLEGVRCDGAFHDGCEALCLVFWKEAWLRRGSEGSVDSPGAVANDPRISAAGLPQAARVFASARTLASTPSDEPVYSCQATAAQQFTAAPQSGELSYWRDVCCGNVTWRNALRAFIVERFNRFQANRGGTQYPPLAGSLTTTPVATLDLRPGELVQVKTRDEIFATIDVEGKNRGLSFDREMLQYCGRTGRVLRRVSRIIDEPSGRMRQMKRDCVILDGFVCESRYHGLCPRAIYPFWREIWLKRASAPVPARAAGGEPSFVWFVLGNAARMVTSRILGRRNDRAAQITTSS